MFVHIWEGGRDMMAGMEEVDGSSRMGKGKVSAVS